MIDLSPILRVVGKVRNRVRFQNSLEWVATAAVLGLLVAMASVGLGRLGVFSDTALSVGVILGFALIPVGFIAGLFQPVSPISAAKRIDISHGLKDRFSSAIDFSNRPKEENQGGRFEEFASLSMKEAVSFAGEVKANKAAPFSAPKDLALSFALALAFALVSMLKLPSDVVATQPKPLATLTPVIVDSFDLEQQKAKAKQLLQEATEDGDKKTAELAEKLLNIWAAVERGEMTQEAALRQLAAIEKELADAAKQKEALEQAAKELSKAFEKNKDTKELANALKNKDFEKAAQELEKLANKLDQMSQKDREELQKALEEAAKLAEEMAKEEKDKRELEDPQDEENPDEKKTDEEREEEEKKRELDNCAALDLATATKEELEECNKNFDKEELEERRRELEEDKRELEKLRRENKEKQQQEEKKRELEKLSRDMKKAAEELEKKLTPEQKEALKQAAEEMKKMGQKQRYADRQQKAAGKIGDAKNVIIRGGKGKNGQAQNFRDRAGQKGQKGQGQQGDGQEGQGQDGQGQNGKGQQPGDGEGDGQEGQGQNGKGKGQGKGQGQGNGQGDTYVIDLDNPGQGDAMVELPGMGDGQGTEPGDQPGGQGDQPGGENWGNGSKDPFGKETDMNVKFTEQKLTGQKGKGPSKVEVIEKVAQEGLVGAQYKKVYKEATREAEDSLEREQVPVGYKRFTKRYFDLIQPQ